MRLTTSVTQLARGLGQVLLFSDERVDRSSMEPDEWLAFADVGAVAMGFGLFVGTGALRYGHGGDTPSQGF